MGMNDVAARAYGDIARTGDPQPAAEERARQDALLRTHAPLVKRIAYHLMTRLPPSVQVDDLIQAGSIGLLEAAKNYDAAQGASFETYAGIRIRGAMLDEIRKGDWAPRSLHRRTRAISGAIQKIEAEQGRDARDDEVAAHLGMSLDDYHKALQAAAGHRIISLGELPNEGESVAADGEGGLPTPHGAADAEDFKRALARAISGLPEREQLVVSLYYTEERNLREIGEVLNVSESRVCQIHGQAMQRLRARLRDWGEN